MKVLLVGEFSGFHLNLKAGLEALGCHATTVSNGDVWKKIDTDISFGSNRPNELARKAETVLRSMNLVARMDHYLDESYDVVQLIHPSLIGRNVFNDLLVDRLLARGRKTALVAAGIDSVSAQAAALMDYSQVMDDPLTVGKWRQPKAIKLTERIARRVDVVIPTLYEYALGYRERDWPNLAAVIPMPFAMQGRAAPEPIRFDGPLRIIHSNTRPREKGSSYIEAAFGQLANDPRVAPRIHGRVPLAEYRQILNSAHAVVDQSICYSWAYTALESLAAGRLVLGGNRPEARESLRAPDCPIFCIRPDADQIAGVIGQIADMTGAERKSRAEEGPAFVRQHHDAVKIAARYLDAWSNC